MARGAIHFHEAPWLEYICSRIRKFASPDFAGDCRDWALIMGGWRNVPDTVFSRSLELDQRTAVRDPDAAAAQVDALLELIPSEIAAFAGVPRRERPEMTDPSAGIVADILETGWPPARIETFRGIRGAEMDADGYTYDARYSC